MDNDYFFRKVFKFIKYAHNPKNRKKEFVEIPDKYNSENTLNNFYIIYDNLPLNLTIKGKMYKTFFYVFGIKYLLLVIFRIFITLSEFTGPLIMAKILGITSKAFDLSNEEKEVCYYYILTFITFTFARIMVSNYYGYLLKLFKIQITTIISDLIYKKILKLNFNEGNIQIQAEISKVFSEDIAWVFHFFINANYLWELPFSI
jgi:hypothetical protein